MLYPARWKKITVDQSKVLKNLLFRYFWATRYLARIEEEKEQIFTHPGYEIFINPIQ